MRIKEILCVLVFTFSVLLMGCKQNILDDTKIYNDIEQEFQSITGNAEEIVSCEIIERDTDIKNQKDIAICKIISENNEVKNSKYYEIKYKLEDRNWEIYSFKPKMQEKWTKDPLIGIGEVNFTDYINGKNIVVEGYDFLLDIANIISYTEIAQNTELNKKKETIALNVKVRVSPVLIATGEMELIFVYNDGWMYDGYTIIKAFETAYEEGKELFITDKMLIEEVQNNPFLFVNKSEDTQQKVAIGSSNISDFTQKGTMTYDLGTVKVCNFSFVSNYSIVSFEINAEATYEYNNSNGWQLSKMEYLNNKMGQINLDPILGEWRGKMAALKNETNKDTIIVFSITEVNSNDGTFKVKLEQSVENVSCWLNGFVSYTDLSVSIKFSEWIEKPKRWADIYEPIFKGIININPLDIKCLPYFDLNSNGFEIKKIEAE